MAVLTTGDASLDVLEDLSFAAGTPDFAGVTELRFLLPATGDVLIYTGNFQRNLQGDVTGGTITAISQETAAGASRSRLEGLSITLDDLRKLVVAGDVEALLARLLNGNDTVTGGAGDDRLLGFAGVDSITGGAGDDTLEGGDDNDSLDGGAGSDRLDGGKGNDTLSGGDGDDTYVVDSPRDVIREAAGGGRDTVEAASSFRLADNIENLRLLGTRNINGTGNAVTNLIEGNGGNNRLRGLGGADTLVGGAGDDTLDGGPGSDTMSGGEGDDTYLVRSAGDRVEEADGEGSDTLNSSLDVDLRGGFIEHAILVDGAVFATGNDADNQLTGNALANTLDGGEGDDTLLGGDGLDLLLGGAGNDLLDGGGGGDTLIGGEGDDTYVLDSLSDHFEESDGEGSDTLVSSFSISLAGTFIEHLTLADGAISGTGNDADNRISGNRLANTLVGAAGDDTLDGGAGDDTLIGGEGDDTYIADSAADIVTEADGEGRDLLVAGFDATLEGGFVEDLSLAGRARRGVGDDGDNVLTGNARANILVGAGGDDTLDGAAGRDRLEGGEGDDTYYVDSKGDRVIELDGEGDDTVVSTLNYSLAGSFVENLRLSGAATSATGNDGDNTLTGNDGANTLDGGAGADLMAGGAGDDVYRVDDPGDVVDEGPDGGRDTVLASISLALPDEVERLVLQGTDPLDGSGNGLANELLGNAAVNTLDGGAGDDTLDGGAGADRLVGGAGDDTFVSDSPLDDIVELDGEGIDTLIVPYDFSLAGSFLEHLVLTGRARSGTGNEADNRLTGNRTGNTLSGAGGEDVLDGGKGADTLIGGAGDDVYFIDRTSDRVLEAPGEGQDEIRSTVSLSLAALPDVERLTLLGRARLSGTGNDADNVITGNDGANLLTGGAGDDTLDGGAGADRMRGGAGDDTFVVDASGDRIEEGTGDGQDLVLASASHALSANVEALTLTGTDDIDGTGNSLDNTLTGNDGANTLDGGAGADLLAGGDGDDVYVVDDAGDAVTEEADAGQDRVVSSVDFELGDNVEELVLAGAANLSGTGNALDNLLVGNGGSNSLSGGGGADTLDGAGGADTLVGGDGDDTYIADVPGDVVVEADGEGIDTLVAAFDASLEGSFVEHLVLSGNAAIDGSGNDADNRITGNGAANTLSGGGGDDTLDGGAGRDWLVGGTGDDTFVVDDARDTVVEEDGAGQDMVRAASSYVLPDNVESLVLTGAGNTSGTGNDLANTLTGNAGRNTLDGAAGADTLAGGEGDDVYLVDDAGDRVDEAEDEGHDTVLTSVSFTLGDHVEALVLTGSDPLDGTGNDADNVITGNSAVNTLTGGAGNDTLDGGAEADRLVGNEGDDVFTVDNAGDAVVEAPGEGEDTVRSTVDWTLGDDLENLVLLGAARLNGTGNALGNAITGNGAVNTLSGLGGDDTLDGGESADRLVGGEGDDRYVVDATGDLVVEEAGEGSDTVSSSVSFSLPDNVENLDLEGEANLRGTGNELDNTLTGNAGNNLLRGRGGDDTLDGGEGADRMQGGQGDDTYFVDSSRDRVEETAGEGEDTVHASIAFTLPGNVERLVLIGASNVDGTGNGLDNRIAGNDGHNRLRGLAGADTLSGGGGDDTLDGGTGADSMSGGSGDDFYLLDEDGDFVEEDADAGTDTVSSQVSRTLEANVENLVLLGRAVFGVGNDLANAITGNALANTLTGGAGDDTLDGGRGADTLVGGTGDDTFIGVEAADTIVEADGEGIDTVVTSVNYDLAGSFVENLVLQGRARFGGGNDEANLIVGNEAGNTLSGAGGDDLLSGAGGNDTLDGGTGDDTLVGGAGNDTYVVDSAGDVVQESPGRGTDRVLASVDHVLAANVENLELTGGDGIDGTGNGLANRITGNAGDNTLLGLGGNDRLSGGEGDDRLDGGAGADSMDGGAGDDVFVFDSLDSRVVGGAGTDTVALVDADQTMDLTALPDNRYLGIERIDLTGTGDNSLVLARADLLALSDTSDTLIVDGDAGDAVTALGAGWVAGADVDIGGVLYQSFTNGAAILLVNPDITDIALGPA